MDTVFLMRIGNRQAACRAQASTSWVDRDRFSALFRSVTDAMAGGPARTYQKSPAVLAIRCTPNTGKGSPAARILSLFGL
jgi:hypothetical protein